MKRREFIGWLGGGVLVSPRLAFGQATPARRMPVVGFVGFADAAIDTRTIKPFRDGLRELGYVEGSTILIKATSP